MIPVDRRPRLEVAEILLRIWSGLPDAPCRVTATGCRHASLGSVPVRSRCLVMPSRHSLDSGPTSA